MALGAQLDRLADHRVAEDPPIERVGRALRALPDPLEAARDEARRAVAARDEERRENRVLAQARRRDGRIILKQQLKIAAQRAEIATLRLWARCGWGAAGVLLVALVLAWRMVVGS